MGKYKRIENYLKEYNKVKIRIENLKLLKNISNYKDVGKIEKSIMKLESSQKMIENSMGILDSVEREIIAKRYFKKLLWTEISEDTSYSETWCKEKRRGAIVKLGEVLYI